MERNVSFETQGVNDIAVHLAWAQLEIFAADVDKIQVLVAGDEGTVGDLRIVLKEGQLTVEQPQYGLSLNITESKWLQVCVRLPLSWNQGVHCNTLSGLLSARKLSGNDVALETVTGDLHVSKMKADTLALKTVSGDVRGEELAAEKLNVRSVNGDIVLDALDVQQLKCTSVSGEQTYNMTGSFASLEVTAVSGNVIITAPVEAMNVSLRSISGRVRTEGVNITDSGSVPVVRVTGVTADLKLVSIKE